MPLDLRVYLLFSDVAGRLSLSSTSGSKPCICISRPVARFQARLSVTLFLAFRSPRKWMAPPPCRSTPMKWIRMTATTRGSHCSGLEQASRRVLIWLLGCPVKWLDEWLSLMWLNLIVWLWGVVYSRKKYMALNRTYGAVRHMAKLWVSLLFDNVLGLIILTALTPWRFPAFDSISIFSILDVLIDLVRLISTVAWVLIGIVLLRVVGVLRVQTPCDNCY